MKELFDSAQILINVALRAQKGGLLSLEEAVSVKGSIDIQTKYYTELGEQLQSQQEQENIKPQIKENLVVKFNEDKYEKLRDEIEDEKDIPND